MTSIHSRKRVFSACEADFGKVGLGCFFDSASVKWLPGIPGEGVSIILSLRAAAARSRRLSCWCRIRSGSASGAVLIAQMYSIYATLQRRGLNPYRWTSEYLNACARNDRQAPADLGPSLPWRMDGARRAELSQPLPGPSAPEAALGELPERPWTSSPDSSPAPVGPPTLAADLRLATQSC